MPDISNLELTQRRQRILRFVVETHISTGTPVGSKTLANAGGFAYAPSTLRYELSWLEQAGLLGHPHTSAGRVPTELGYRFYAEQVVAQRQSAPLALDFGQAHREVEEALRSTTDALAAVSNLLALVTAPPASAAVIRHVEVLLLQPQVVMVVVITASGGVEKRLIAFDQPVDAKLVEWAKAYLNESLAGIGLGTSMLRRRVDAAELPGREREFLHAIAPAFADPIDQAPERIFVGGASRLISELRARNVHDLALLAAALEERATMLALLHDAVAADGVVVRIGTDQADPRMHPLAMVAAGYGVGARNLGVVSLIGPVRMDYQGAVASVRGAASALADFLEQVYN